MDTRKIEILNAIIKSYIDSAVPVGSRTLSKCYEWGISSATIRNEMADLEDLGYLNKPHSSAGRIPSNKAYRFYVDEILNAIKLDLFDKDIRNSLMDAGTGTESFYRSIVKSMAKSTGLFTFLISPKKNCTLIKHIELLKLDDNILLLLLIGDNGQVERKVISYNGDIDDADILKIKDILNKKLTLVEFDEISEIEVEISGDLTRHRQLIFDIVKEASDFNRNIKSVDIYYDGLSNILSILEFSDMNKAVNFVSRLEDETLFKDIMKIDLLNDIDISIGDENEDNSLSDFAVIRAYVKGFSKDIVLGVLGPVRMDYQNALEKTLIYRNVLKNIVMR